MTISGSTLVVELSNYASGTVVADAVRIQQIQGDHGLDDDFHVESTSPTIDAGDPGSLYLAEPAPNGGRVNQGYDGNTSSAAQSASPLVQMLAPNGLEKYVQGQSVTVQWRSNGLTNNVPVALINAGGPEVGTWSADAYRTDETSSYTSTISTTVSTSGVTNPAPQAVYQSYDYANSGVGNALTYQLPVPNGTYTLRLHFVEPTYSSAGQRKFNVVLQGTTVQSNYDIYVAAGAMDRATTLSFTVTASGGSGISLALVNVTSAPAILSGIELSAANPSGTASPTVNLQVSADNGNTWTTIASNLATDNYGSGSYVWTVPANETPGNQYLMRAVANSGGSPVGVSAGNFLVAPSGGSYYVNASATGGQYTTAAGNNLNSGKAPNQPMASLAALLAAYNAVFQPGNTIYVDTGTYHEVRTIVLTAADSGIIFQGPTATGSPAVINRGNTSSGQYVFQLTGAQNVTLDHLWITGGYDGVYAASGAGSTYLTLSNSTVYDNDEYGVDLEPSNDHPTLAGNTVDGTTSSPYYQSYGFYLDSVNYALISGNTVYNSENSGMYLYGVQDVVNSNTVYQCGTGIEVADYVSGAANQSQATNNTVHDNTSEGISVSSNALAEGNTVYRTAGSGYGIEVSSGAIAQQNTVHDNVYGIYISGGGQRWATAPTTTARRESTILMAAARPSLRATMSTATSRAWS